jgi:copper chaperone CopZ
MKTIELTVEGMTCGSCVKHVKQALQAVPGVVHVEVDLLSGRARVQGDLQVGSTSLIAALAEEDYVANIATESSPATATTKPGSTSQPRNSGRCCCG